MSLPWFTQRDFHCNIKITNIDDHNLLAIDTKTNMMHKYSHLLGWKKNTLIAKKIKPIQCIVPVNGVYLLLYDKLINAAILDPQNSKICYAGTVSKTLKGKILDAISIDSTIHIIMQQYSSTGYTLQYIELFIYDPSAYKLHISNSMELDETTAVAKVEAMNAKLIPITDNNSNKIGMVAT